MGNPDYAGQKGVMLAAALNYLKMGGRPIPILFIEQDGKQKKVVPLTGWPEFQLREPTTSEIKSWWDRWPRAGVAIVTGPGSELCVIDIDSEEGERNIAPYLDGVITRTCLTGGGGRHVYFKHPGTHITSTIKILPGVDIRADDACVAVPPSIHNSGVPYRWDDENGRGFDCPIAPLPPALLEFLTTPHETSKPKKARPKADRAGRPSDLPDIIEEGRRNRTLFEYACSLRACGLSYNEILPVITDANQTRCTSPLGVADVAQIVESASQYEPGSGASDATADGLEHFTDFGNARRLVRYHGTDLRYVPTWSAWYVWNEGCWARDRTGEVERRAKDTVCRMYADASAIEDSGQRAALAKWALASESEKHLKAMVGLARSEPGIATAVESLDQDPWLFNVSNGTIDLRTGALRPHDPRDLITRVVKVPYEPDATAPRWLAFLDTVTGGNQELAAYLQRFVGYSLTGDVGEQKLAFLQGYGCNGKTTYLNTMLEILGPYGKQADPQLLMARTSDAHPTNVADLMGSRFVVCSEVDEGRSFAEATVKQLTGGDRLKARLMRQDFFEFQPTHKIWMAANHQPRVTGTDHAFWRRMQLIPFEVTIPADERDPDLPTKLRAELPGILAWAVRGCVAWQAGGLQEPECVRAASDAYRSGMDLIASFVEECCVEEPAAEVFAKALYGVYQRWCTDSGIHPCSMPSFGRRMMERGYRSRKSTGGMTRYQGIALRQVEVEVVEDPIGIPDSPYEGLFGESDTENTQDPPLPPPPCPPASIP